MFVVAGVTGQTGAAVAQALLNRNELVRVLVRSKEKGAVWKARGADVCTLSLDDSAALTAALEGADGAYLLVPPVYESSDPNATASSIVDGYVAALSARPVRRVVVLSSIGAQHATGTGPIIPCHYAERELGKLSETSCTFLRSAYFMENLKNFLGAIKGEGVLPVLFSPARKTTMVSVEDIGKIAADILIDSVRGHQVLEISGPTDHSFDDVAALFSRALGIPVKTAQVPEAHIVATLTGLGMPGPTAKLYREMAMAVDAGLVAFERGSVRQVRGSRNIEDFVRTLAS